MHTVRKKYIVQYAHQLKDSFTTQCWESMHGHQGVVELFFQCNDLDKDAMVIDFGHISEIVKPWIMETFDHAVIVPSGLDPEYIESIEKFNKRVVLTPSNPTAEYFAVMIYEQVEQLILNLQAETSRRFWLHKVRFHETDSGFAEYTR